MINSEKNNQNPAIEKNINLKRALMFCFLLFILYSAFFLNKIHNKIDDSAYFGGDTWEYQSMGVNFALGHSLKFGGIEQFKAYKFQKLTSVEESYKQSFLDAGKRGGDYDFYRAPAYPFFLGLVYKLFGVHPGIAKIFQLLMITFVGAFLPMAGYYFWEKKGLMSGLIAGIIFIYEYYNIYDKILTEPLIIFSIFLVLGAYIYHCISKNRLSSLLFGLALALIFLTKGSLWFMPFLFIGYFAYQTFKKKIYKKEYLLIISLVFILPIVCYSWFASAKANQFILVTTQESTVLLDGNNEKTIKSGHWEPSGTTDPNGIYEKNKNLSTIAKLTLFYREHLTDVPLMVANKIRSGFSEMPFLFSALVLANLEMIFSLQDKFRKSKKNFYLGLLVFYSVGVFISLFFYSIVGLILSTIFLSLVAFYFGVDISKNLPIPLILFFNNFLLLTIITFGTLRFTMVIDVFFILITINYFFLIFKKTYSDQKLSTII